MKKLTLNILLFILLLTAAVISACWVGLCADNGISYLDKKLNEPEPESLFISGLVDYPNKDLNEPEPKSI
jgi:hypothetical protein